MITGVWRYELQPVGGKLPPRQGALLRYYGNARTGFSDLHPWTELGDLPIEEQLCSAREGVNTPLLDAAASRARGERAARLSRGSLGTKGLAPRNHASLPFLLRESIKVNRLAEELNELSMMGFDRVKLKLGLDLAAEADRLIAAAPAFREQGFEVRLDCNQRLNSDQIQDLLRRLSSHQGGLEWLDWVEDPCAWSFNEWTEIKQEFGVRLALDFAADATALNEEIGAGQNIKKAVDVLIYKPAIDAHRAVPKFAGEHGLGLAVTSYLGHPVEQVAADFEATMLASVAAIRSETFKLEQGGLCSHLAYEPNAFSERLAITDGRLVPTNGDWFDFDDLLAALPWEPL